MLEFGIARMFPIRRLQAAKRSSVRHSLLVGIVLAALVAGANGGPEWEKPSLFPGSLDIDGGLQQRFEPGTLSGSPEIAFHTHTPSGLKKSVAVWRSDTPVAPTSRSSSSSQSTIQNLQSSIDNPALLQKTTCACDALNRYPLISVNDGPEIHFGYDLKALRLERKRCFNGWIVACESYDDGHPKSIVPTDDKGKTATDCHYVWSQNGKLDQRILNGILHQYRYDLLGRLTDVIKTEVAKNQK